MLFDDGRIVNIKLWPWQSRLWDNTFRKVAYTQSFRIWSAKNMSQYNLKCEVYNTLSVFKIL